jgi:hypothetical protein
VSFSSDFAKESDNAIKAVNETIKVAAIDLMSGTITSSPVGNPDLWKSGYAPPGYTGGSFRSNWYLTQFTPSVKYDGDLVVSRSDKITGIVNSITRKDSTQWILTNNAPYAQRIESGWSTQAPAGVVAPNLSRVNAKFSQIEKAVNRKYGVS